MARTLFTFTDLFAGIGGFRIGLEMVGGRCVYSVERDKYCRKVYGRWFGDEPEGGDIDEIDPHKVPPHHIMAAGFPCFAKGTLVLTRDGYKPIEDMVVGDEVLTHRGRWRRVTSTMSRDAAVLRHIKAQGVNVTTTDEHPFFARVRTMKWNNSRRADERSFGDPHWVDAANLTKNHFLAQVLPCVRSNRRSADFWWLVGRYLADGWRVRRKGRRDAGRTVICCSHDEADELRDRITKAGFHATPSLERTVVKFHITVNWLYRFLAPFGKHADGKMLPGFVFSLSREKVVALLDGYLSGDGYVRKTCRRATTVSKRLAFSIALLAQRTGVVASVEKCPTKPTKMIEGRLVRQKCMWFVVVPNRNRSGFVDGQYGWKLVRKSEKCGRGTVYNISVEDDESYVADGAIVHNCQSFSLAGVSTREFLGKPHGFDCERQGNLFFRLADVLDARRPIACIFENVKNLKSHDKGDTWRVIRETLDGLDYEVHAQVLDAQDFMVPQHRERVIIVGFDRRRIPNPRFMFPKPTGHVTLASILEDDPPASSILPDGTWRWLREHAAKHEAAGHGFGFGMADPAGVTRTLSARYHKDGSEILIEREDGNPRKLSLREAARLMGFPDHLPVDVVSRTQTYRQFGNAVVPNVIEAVGRRVMWFLNAAGGLKQP